MTGGTTGRRRHDPAPERCRWRSGSTRTIGAPGGTLMRRSPPAPRKRARETLARSPATTSSWARLAHPARCSRPLKSSQYNEKTGVNPRALPECEHGCDWVAEGAVPSEPVSPRFSPRTSWAHKSRIRDGSRQVPEYPASSSHDGRAPRVVMGTRRDPAPFLGVRGVCAHTSVLTSPPPRPVPPGT